jgi:uncharacterized membrane protein
VATSTQMTRDDPSLPADIGRHPIHTVLVSVLVSFSAACFVGAFVTDFVYWRSTSFIWETFSVWLLTAGLVMAGLAVIAALIDFMTNRRVRESRPRWNAWNVWNPWAYVLGSGLVIVLSVFNVFVHSRDGYTAVVPTGIMLSGIVVVIMMITGWIGRARVHRRRAGVSD